jgi:hypothetical protein
LTPTTAEHLEQLSGRTVRTGHALRHVHHPETPRSRHQRPPPADTRSPRSEHLSARPRASQSEPVRISAGSGFESLMAHKSGSSPSGANIPPAQTRSSNARARALRRCVAVHLERPRICRWQVAQLSVSTSAR